MKITRILVAASLATMLIAGTAAAANPKTKTFGSATVTEGPVGTFTIVSDGPDPVYAPSPEYGGVYLNSKSTSGKAIGSVAFSFTSTGDVAGGAPRFSLPIDTDGNGSVEFYAFLDAAGCGGVSDETTVVSTASATCSVDAGGETFANWAAFATAHPLYRVAPGHVPFIIADGTEGTYVISNIQLR